MADSTKGTSMGEFKVGDRVVCRDGGNAGWLIEGEVYTVLAVREYPSSFDGLPEVHVLPDHPEHSWFASRFELVESPVIDPSKWVRPGLDHGGFHPATDDPTDATTATKVAWGYFCALAAASAPVWFTRNEHESADAVAVRLPRSLVRQWAGVIDCTTGSPMHQIASACRAALEAK